MTDPRFAQAEQHYHSLKARRDVGQLSDQDFDRALWDAMFECDGRWWVLGVNTGKWYASEGDDWVERNPPALQPKVAPTSVAPAPSATSATDASDRTIAAQVLRFLVLGAIAVFAVYCIYTGYEAWIHRDQPGGVVTIAFGLLLLAAIALGGTLRSRR